MLGNSVLRLLILAYAPAILSAIGRNVAACVLLSSGGRAIPSRWAGTTKSLGW